MHGISGCLDPILYTWLSYTPHIRFGPVPPSDAVSSEAPPKERQLGQHGPLIPLIQVQGESKGKQNYQEVLTKWDDKMYSDVAVMLFLLCINIKLYHWT